MEVEIVAVVVLTVVVVDVFAKWMRGMLQDPRQ